MENEQLPYGKDRRKPLLNGSEREWLASVLDGFRDQFDTLAQINKQQHETNEKHMAEVGRRLGAIEVILIGTGKEKGLSEDVRGLGAEVKPLRKLVYGAVGILLTALLVQTFFRGKG